MTKRQSLVKVKWEIQQNDYTLLGWEKSQRIKAQLNKMRGMKCIVLSPDELPAFISFLESPTSTRLYTGRSSDEAYLSIDWYAFAAGMKFTRNSSLEARAVALADLCILDAATEKSESKFLEGCDERFLYIVWRRFGLTAKCQRKSQMSNRVYY